MATTIKEQAIELVSLIAKKVKIDYYLKTEVDASINAKDATNTLLNGYTKPASTGAIGTSDSTQVAIGKLEKGLESATAGGGDVNVQSDFNVTDNTSDAYILNKPDLTLKADLIAGKVPTAQLPDSVLGGLKYQGTWDATTVAPTAGEGFYYIVSVAGTTDLDGETDWQINDWAVSNGTTWSKIDNTQSVQVVTGNSIVAPFETITQAEVDTAWDNA